jgi:hypothetical protein
MVGRVRGTVITKNRVRTENPHNVLSQKIHKGKKENFLRQQQPVRTREATTEQNKKGTTVRQVTNNRNSYPHRWPASKTRKIHLGELALVFDHLYLVATATQPVIQKLSKSIMKRVKKPNLVVHAFGIKM